MAFEVLFEPDAIEHLQSLSARDRTTVLDAVRKQLTHTPTRETRNRKQLQPNPLARWELRVGSFRVFYDCIESQQRVRVLAIGRKEHQRLLIAGKEYEL